MATWNPGDMILGEYLIEKKLGQGGMGEVFLVKSQSTSRQFAVKRALVRDEKSRKMFLAELQTWIDLSEHPNIVPCRFFRTVGDEIVIFADYIAGGSLADWIAKRKLTTVDQILDVAIQFAWGLHAVHEHGLIHQDVKPGNVLMTPDGVPLVTDFGLSRARLRASDGHFISPVANQARESVLISAGGMTPAYASPEQRAGQPLSRKTDIWSWGVSVLDMFMGGVSCPHGGHIAGEVLEDFQEIESNNDTLRMPPTIAAVLRRCFRNDTAERWGNLAKAAEAFRQSYQQNLGKAYGRQTPTSVTIKSVANEYDHRIMKGAGWDKPVDWLRYAYIAAGQDPNSIMGTRHTEGAHRAQALADLAIYQEAGALFKEQISQGSVQYESALAIMLMHQAVFHMHLDDLPGTLSCYDQAITIFARLLDQNNRQELAPCLAATYMNKANVLENEGDFSQSIKLYDKCIAIREQLVKRGGWREIANDLAMVFMNKAIALKAMLNLAEAIELYDKCIVIRERLVEQEGRRELANDLAMAYMNKAVTLEGMGNLAEALELYDKCIAIQERLVGQEGRFELANDLATAYMNKAVTLEGMGNPVGAIELYDKSIAIRERLVGREGRHELANRLAMAYMNKANALADSGDLTGVLELYDKCIAIRERLVGQEGRRELANDLATAYMNKAVTLEELDNLTEAVGLYSKCIAIRERLVMQERRGELRNELAKAYMNKANALKSMGDLPRAIEYYGKCSEILEQIGEKHGRNNLKE